jgi:hypothetical protein
LWGDLHVVLELYLECIEGSGKFVVDAENPGFGDPDGLVTEGWRIEEWTNKELTQALDIWSSLVDVITARLPGAFDNKQEQPDNKEEASDNELQPKKRRKNEDEVMIPLDILNRYPAIPPFARFFLSQAKKPPFTCIAPQLDIPNEEFIHRVGAELQEEYPDASITTPQHEIIYCPRFPLFSWRTPISQDVRDGSEHGTVSRFGLFLEPDVFYAHASTLLLPFQLGGNHKLLRGDGVAVDRPAQDALYQHGICNPFTPSHGTPLAAILVNWWEQIENEWWSVDETGVVGGEELWKRADTEEHAEHFKADWAC